MRKRLVENATGQAVRKELPPALNQSTLRQSNRLKVQLPGIRTVASE